MPRLVIALMLILVSAPSSSLAQTRLTLAEAIARARANNLEVQAAAGAEREADARVSAVRGAFLPKVDLAESWQRGDQPVFVFSSLLSQRQFTAANFAIDALNHPPATNNFRTALTVDQAVYSPSTNANLRTARIGLEIAGKQRTALNQTLAVAVTDAYGRVIAVDAATVAVHELRAALGRRHLSWVEVVEGFEADLDLAAFHPDVVFARWFYWFLPEPEAAVRRVANALRPGGRLAVMDYANYRAIGTEPRAERFDRVFRAVYQSVADAGGSLDIAAHMPAMFRVSGLRTTGVVALGQVARPGEPVWEWVSTFQRLHLPPLVEKGYLPADELSAHLAWWSALEASLDALFFAPPVLGVVGVKD